MTARGAATRSKAPAVAGAPVGRGNFFGAGGCPTEACKHSPMKPKVMAEVQRRQRSAFDSFGFTTNGT